MKDMTFSEILRAELTRRIAKNSNYSLRSFAKALEVDPSHLSRLLSGKRKISYALAIRLCKKLGLDTQVAEQLRPQFSWSERKVTSPVHFVLDVELQELTQEKLDAVLRCIKGEFPSGNVEVRAAPSPAPAKDRVGDADSIES